MPWLEAGGRRLHRHNNILCLPHSDGHPPKINILKFLYLGTPPAERGIPGHGDRTMFKSMIRWEGHHAMGIRCLPTR
jgi:hypothetical protein